MKDSELELNLPFLAARGDGEGTFARWLMELHFPLADKLSVYTNSKMGLDRANVSG